VIKDGKLYRTFTVEGVTHGSLISPVSFPDEVLTNYPLFYTACHRPVFTTLEKRRAFIARSDDPLAQIREHLEAPVVDDLVDGRPVSCLLCLMEPPSEYDRG
jgi:hypothetical protein